MNKLRIGTRTSALATWQARRVEHLLNEKGIETELVGITTSGDRSLGGDLSSQVGQFIHAVDKKLMEGHIDLAVHSSKDVPVDVASSIACLSYLERGSTSDVLIFQHAPGLDTLDQVLKHKESSTLSEALMNLAKGSTVGTVSGRRQSFLLSQRPDLIPIAVRGRVETRLKRLHEGRVDTIVLAEVGLQRLHSVGGLEPWMLKCAALRISDTNWPTAPGQGAISVHCRTEDQANLAHIRSILNHPMTEDSVTKERELLSSIGGGCLYPAGIQVKGQQVDVKIAPKNWRAIFCKGRSFETFHFSGHYDELNISLPSEDLDDGLQMVDSPKIVSTLNSDRISHILHKKGIAVVNQPVVTLTPKHQNWPSEFIETDSVRSSWPYLVLTSPFAARCAVEVSGENQDINRIQWLAIGEGTARACFRMGVTVSICAQARNAKELAAFIMKKIPTSTPLMLPKSDIGSSYLAEELTRHGYDVTAWVGYENQIKKVPHVELESNDVLLLSSPSSAMAWVENGLPIPTNILCMGLSTQKQVGQLAPFSQSSVEVLDGPTVEFITSWWNQRRDEDAS
ncbi:MAG: hypothetical protein CMA65_04830 [Euryarchaeota archaeon]|nr:hypothetical protein [Euryarchaeota archaeon]